MTGKRWNIKVGRKRTARDDPTLVLPPRPRSSRRAPSRTSEPSHDPAHSDSATRNIPSSSSADAGVLSEEQEFNPIDCIDEDLSIPLDASIKDLGVEAGTLSDLASQDQVESSDSEDNGDQEESSITAPTPLLSIDWRTLASLLNTTGTDRYTAVGFERFLWYVNEFADEKMPSCRTVRRGIRNSALAHAFVKSETHLLTVNFAKSGAKAGVGQFASQTKAPVMIVKPSEWAKRDVQTHSIEKIIREGSSNGQLDARVQGHRTLFASIEDSPIVRNREDVLSGIRVPNEKGGVSLLQKGSNLSIKMKHTEEACSLLHQSGFEYKAEGKSEIGFTAAVRSVTAFHSSVTPEAVEPEPTTRPAKRRKGVAANNEKRLDQASPPCKPGDIIVDITCNGRDSAREFSVYISFRFWLKSHTREHRVSILFMAKEMTPSMWKPGELCVRCVVLRITEAKGDGFIGASITRSLEVASFGNLKDGRRYTIYRFLLYADGFTPQLGKKGSMGGCYMLPLGMLPDRRSAVGAVRKIGLAPPGVSTNEILMVISDDIVKGAVEGFVTKDSQGKQVVAFLDCVGFIADYPAMSEALDVLGHNSNVPCHLCAFSRYDKSGSGHSAYGYTTAIQSSHPSFCRLAERSHALRTAKISDSDLRAMGFQESAVYTSKVNALHGLSTDLSSIRMKIPRTEHDIPVVPGVFEPYRSCIIAPDHLFLGLSHDVINCFLKHASVRVRKRTHEIAKRLLRENQLFFQNELFNSEKMEVNSMSITGMYALLFVMPTASNTALFLEGGDGSDVELVRKCTNLLEHFQRLVSRTQFFPDLAVDGRDSVDDFNREGGNNHLHLLKRMAEDYIRKLSSLCRDSEKARKCLDKPNVHRLLEFFHFTLPAFGSARLVQELVLERAHQELKRAYVRSNFHNAQLQCMEHAIANDWAARLGIELEDVSLNGEGWS